MIISKANWEEEDDPQAGEPGAEEKPIEPSKPAEGADGPYKMKAGRKEIQLQQKEAQPSGIMPVARMMIKR